MDHEHHMMTTLGKAAEKHGGKKMKKQMPSDKQKKKMKAEMRGGKGKMR